MFLKFRDPNELEANLTVNLQRHPVNAVPLPCNLRLMCIPLSTSQWRAGGRELLPRPLSDRLRLVYLAAGGPEMDGHISLACPPATPQESSAVIGLSRTHAGEQPVHVRAVCADKKGATCGTRGHATLACGRPPCGRAKSNARDAEGCFFLYTYL